MGQAVRPSTFPTVLRYLKYVTFLSPIPVESPPEGLSDIFRQLHRFSKLSDIMITFPECFEYDDHPSPSMCRLQTAVLYCCGKSNPPDALRSFTFTNLWPYGPLSQTVRNGDLRRFLSIILSFTLIISKKGYDEGAYCTEIFMDFFGGDFNALLDCLPAALTTLSIKNPLLHCWTGPALPQFHFLTSLRLEKMLFFKPYSLTDEIVQPKDYNTSEGFILRHNSIEQLRFIDCSMDVPEDGFDPDRTWASFVTKGLREQHLPNLKQLQIVQRGIVLGPDGQTIRGGGYARLDVGYGYFEAPSLDDAAREADAVAFGTIQGVLSLRRASYVN